MQGWSQAILEKGLRDAHSLEILTASLNQLLGKNRLRILRSSDGTVVYQEVTVDEAAKCVSRLLTVLEHYGPT